ncbi:Caffeate CoA-transferase [Andreprevotia sp. IGB-42]|uniref:acyl CoA:acetate/3-ketoacid CoA transferase n=1 Tax=Andreprevotia sp. IGB-42 TaxID=2497473 RepID=UPI001357AB4C|nr:CoA-transferase [Andreprevotia sp. IGB-42]KAF0811306.1 Caffeate CoA-transferase [Andreprevotia sp. IGB-42]
MKIITASQAAQYIQDDWWIIAGGFGCCGHPDSLTQSLRTRYLETGRPRRLNLLFASGAGDKRGKGVDALALKGLISTVIGGFWGFCPGLVKMARQGQIEAHNWPQGVICKLFSSIASGAPGLLSKVGLGTFIDPQFDGGVIDTRGSTPRVEKLPFHGQQWLFYPSQKVDCALLRGTAADELGNISFADETSFMDAQAQALAVKNSGGTVIVQVKRLIAAAEMRPSDVKIPGFLVDYVVLAEDAHPQTYGKQHEAAYTARAAPLPARVHTDMPLAKQIIVARAALELEKHRGANVNLGIGIPALLGAKARELGIADYTLTIESGLVGGIPDEGLSFGASLNPQAVMDQAALFDFYDGGGIDVSFLGFGEVDVAGNVNVSKFGNRIHGAGGFVNISQSARKIVFCGTLTAQGLEVAMAGAGLKVLREGRTRKFVPAVSHLTFSGRTSAESGQEVLYITERAVFALVDGRLLLREIAPGISISELMAAMDCEFLVSDSLLLMPNFVRQEAGLCLDQAVA